jgi:hypothetical protein
MISGKSFADTCTWIYCPRYKERPFNNWTSRHGDRVFINGDYLDQFLNISLPTFKQFILVIHNSDIPFDENRLRRTLPRALRIYAINTTVTHPQLTTIPIGFPDSGVKHVPGIRHSSDRHIEIYSNFSSGTNLSARAQCLKAFEGDSRVVRKDPVGRTQPEFYRDMCHSKFVLCPEGTGIDTHRLYEALACGAIPVVLHTSLDHLYKKLPVCILNSWTDPLYVPEGKIMLHVQDYL